MSMVDQIRDVQRAVGVAADGNAGPLTWAAIHRKLGLDNEHVTGSVTGKASSFADPADIRAFKKAKARGLSDQQAFKFGDNGIGCWGDDVTNITIPYVAIRPDDMIAKWGSTEAARHKTLLLTIDDKTHACIAGDRMPWAKNVTNGAVIDLAPGAQILFDLTAPFMLPCSWRWA